MEKGEKTKDKIRDFTIICSLILIQIERLLVTVKLSKDKWIKLTMVLVKWH